MNIHLIKWTTVLGTILLLVAGNAWADGKSGRGPGKGNGKGYHAAHHKPDGKRRSGGYHNPPNFKPNRPKFHRKPNHSPYAGHGKAAIAQRPPYRHHRPTAPSMHHHRPAPPVVHHRPAPQVVHYRPAPPVVHYYHAPSPPPPQPIGGFLFSAAISDPGFVFGFAIGDSW